MAQSCPKMRTGLRTQTKPCLRTRAAAFARRAVSGESGKAAARVLECSRRTVTQLRGSDDWLPGLNLIERWRERFGAPFDLFIIGDDEAADLAALRADLVALQARLDSLEQDR